MVDHNSEIERWKREGAQEAIRDILFVIDEFLLATHQSRPVDPSYVRGIKNAKSKILAVSWVRAAWLHSEDKPKIHPGTRIPFHPPPPEED